MQRTGTRVAAAVAAGLVVQACLPLLGDRTGVVFDNVLLALIALVTAIGHARQTRLSRHRRRAAWALACAAAVLWSLSSAIDTVDAFLSLDTGSDEFLAVSAAIASLVALVLLGTADRVGPAVRLRRGIDVATVSGALFFLAWEFVLAPASATLPPSASTMITMVLVPEIIGAGYALVLLSHSLSRRGDEALSLLAAGLLGFAATMLLAMHNLVEGLPWYATGVGAGYVIAGLLTALASHAPLPSGTFAEENEDAGRWALLPYVPVSLAFAAAAWRYVHSGNVTAVLFWLLLATSALVLVRQFLSMRTTRKLTDDLRAQRAELAHQASHDALTGLVNRTAFQQRATATVAAAGADGLTGVLLIDLDGFKGVNDTLGHAAGDALLVGVAARLRAAVRAGDTVARLGGDEFVVLLPGVGRADEVDDVGNRVLEHLTEPIDIGSGALTARASVGATVGSGAACDPLELVKQADIALYEAKAAGKGTVRRYVPVQPAAVPG